MAIERMEHVGIVVDDLPEAIEFFLALGLELEGEGTVEGEWADRVVGLEGMRADIAMLRTQDGEGCLELSAFHAPAYAREDRGPEPSHAPGIRHVLFRVDDVDAAVADVLARGAELVGEVVDYGDAYRLCYVRGPAGIIVELAQRLGAEPDRAAPPPTTRDDR